MILFVVPNADKVAGRAEGVPGDVEPAITSQELVGQGVSLQEVDEALELLVHSLCHQYNDIQLVMLYLYSPVRRMREISLISSLITSG